MDGRLLAHVVRNLDGRDEDDLRQLVDALLLALDEDVSFLTGRSFAQRLVLGELLSEHRLVVAHKRLEVNGESLTSKFLSSLFLAECLSSVR